jgi:trehalose 6-phosphate phosphatase
MIAPLLPCLDWCLFLDVDGTLVELTDTPSQTRADAEIKSLLAAVSARLDHAVALVSGREIRTLDELFAPLRLPAAGLHGLERRDAAGAIHGANFADDRLQAARATLQGFVQAHPGTLLEDKGRTLAAHYRLAPQFGVDLRVCVARVAESLGDGYHVQEGSMMFEVKPHGISKATSVAAFMQEAPFRNRIPVFIGDDLTDVDGFGMAERLGGSSIAVGPRVRGQYALPDVSAVRGLLGRIARL